MKGPLCAEISIKSNERGAHIFLINDDELLVRTSDKEMKIVVPPAMEELILYINQYALLDGNT